jgi:hypothetical protein
VPTQNSRRKSPEDNLIDFKQLRLELGTFTVHHEKSLRVLIYNGNLGFSSLNGPFVWFCRLTNAYSQLLTCLLFHVPDTEWITSLSEKYKIRRQGCNITLKPSKCQVGCWGYCCNKFHVYDKLHAPKSLYDFLLLLVCRRSLGET